MSTRRPYQSRLRADRSEETRLRIRESARELFERKGFAQTTIAEIAKSAGVAVPTVYATFGSKSGIVIAMMDELEELAGGEEAGRLVLDAPTPREQLHYFLAFVRALFERGGGVLRAAMAAREDPDVQAMARTGNERRLEGARFLATGWSERGALRPEVPPSAAAEQLWLLTAAEHYFHAVDDLGWTPDAYQAWLENTVVRLMFENA